MHLATKAGVRQQLLNVEQSTSFAVDRILAAAVAKQRAADGDLGVVDRQGAIRVIDGEQNLGATQGPLGRGAGKNDVFHLAAAKGLCALLAHHPGEGINYV